MGNLRQYYTNARQRAKRRKSLWNLMLIPFCFGSAIGIAYALFRLVWLFHAHFYPEHQLGHFWQGGLSTRSFACSFLMVFAPVPGSIGAGFMLGNILAWLIPPARRTFQAEARGHSGTSFQASMRGLFKFTIWTLPIGVAVALAAAYFLKSLQ